MYIFNKQEKEWFDYVGKIPSFVDGQYVFFSMTLISSFTLHGISRPRAFTFLEKCFENGVIRNLTENESAFLTSMAIGGQIPEV